MALPKRIVVRSLGDPITMTQCKLDALGRWNEAKGAIEINEDQPEVGKHLTLIHELLHVCESTMRQQGIIKRRAPHDFIENVSGNLLLLLVEFGLYPGVSKRAMRRFIDEQMGGVEVVDAVVSARSSS